MTDEDKKKMKERKKNKTKKEDREPSKLRDFHACKKYERKGGFLFAHNASCCAWAQPKVQFKRGILKYGNNEFCGLKNITRGRDRFRPACCKTEPTDSIGDCDSFNWPKGPGFTQVLMNASGNDKFYVNYLTAWKVGTENGWKLRKLE